jgi:hypothetical protein
VCKLAAATGGVHVACALAEQWDHSTKIGLLTRHAWAGVTFLRHSRQVIDLMDAWKVEMYAGRQKMNQDALNKVHPTLCKCYNHALDIWLICTGASP